MSGWSLFPKCVLVLLCLLVVACGQPALVGTDLGARPSPDFTLTDQTGHEVSLSRLQGRPIVLTFLYSSCPDICPVTAGKLKQVHDGLGADADKVTLLVVSVDPERDTVDQLRAYTEAVQMTGNWHFLTGERAALAPVWAAYGIAVIPGPNGSLGHTDALFVLDKQGRQRVLMRTDFEPADLIANLRALL